MSGRSRGSAATAHYDMDAQCKNQHVAEGKHVADDKQPALFHRFQLATSPPFCYALKGHEGSDIDLVLNGQAMEWAIIPFLVFDIRDSGSPRSSTVVCGDSA